MKKILLFGSLFVGLLLPLMGQSLQVWKSVGSTVTIDWSFPVASETEIDSFVIEACSAVNSGCTDFVTKLKTDRTHIMTVTTTIKPFYQVRSVKGTNRSVPSNPVGVSLIIQPPVSSSVQ